MRFDDSLKTVLAGEAATGIGASATWRQLVDLIGRGRIAADEPTISRLRLLRQAVPATVRAASGRALAFARPGAALVGLFAEDDLVVSAPVLRTAALTSDEWLAVLPRMSPEGRSILRHRRDLPAEVVRALESFGATDFVLPWEGQQVVETQADESEPTARPEPFVVPLPPADTPLTETPFVALGTVTRALPVVDEALRRQAGGGADKVDPAQGGFVIADLVARIDAFNRARDAGPSERTAGPLAATAFSFETDATGTVRRVDGVASGALVGVSVAHGGAQGLVQVGAAINGALRQRARFADARLDVGGDSDAAGSWRVSGEPVFDDYSGRFLGMRAVARRPRIDEGARQAGRHAASDALRELVHELRTPTNAIAGFAELIEAQLLGPVDPRYRAHAVVIRDQAAILLAAIDDLDTAARIEGGALTLDPRPLPLAALVRRLVAELSPLAQDRGVQVTTAIDEALTILADERAAERLFSRLLATIVATGQGTVDVAAVTIDDAVTLIMPAPRTDAGDEESVSLLGTDFTLRLARNLAAELGGAMEIAGARLVLKLPAAPAR